MAAKHVIKITDIIKFFKDEEKLIRKGENAVESGHISSMTFDENLKVIKGKVHASMRDRQYNVQMFFDSEWEISSAECTCPRGQYLCHHMTALGLYARDNISVTDKACAWNISKTSKDPEVKKIKDIYPQKEHRATSRNLTDEEIFDFKSKLQTFSGAVGFSWMLSEEPQVTEESTVINIEDVIFSKDFIETSNKISYFENLVKVTPDKIVKIAQETVGQSQNSRWLIARKNRLTASNFGIILSACRRNRFSPSLFKRLAGTYDLDHIKAIQWGREHEQEGLIAIEQALNIKVIPIGLWLHECGYIGGSPDGLIGEKAIVEVKCPYKYRDTSINENIKTAHDYIIKLDEEGKIAVNKTHEYYHQIQGLLSVTNRELCYLVIWSPKEVIIVEVVAENYSENIKIIRQFYLSHYIKFLTGEKHIVL